MPSPEARSYATDWERVIREAVAIMVKEQGCTAQNADRAVREALNSSPPIPFPECQIHSEPL